MTILFSTEELLGAITCFNDVLTDKEWGNSDAPHHSAFNRNTGYPLSLFDYYGAQHLVTATFVQWPNGLQKKKISESSGKG